MAPIETSKSPMSNQITTDEFLSSTSQSIPDTHQNVLSSVNSISNVKPKNYRNTSENDNVTSNAKATTDNSRKTSGSLSSKPTTNLDTQPKPAGPSRFVLKEPDDDTNFVKAERKRDLATAFGFDSDEDF